MTDEMKSSQYPEANDAVRWLEFFDLVAPIAVPEEFLGDRRDTPQKRDLFR